MDAPLPEERLSELIARTGLADSFSVASGALLFRQGDAADALLAIEDGEVEIVARTPGDEEVVLARLGSGAVLGELSLIDSGVRSATARAGRPTTGLCLSREAFQMLRAARSPVGSALLARLAALTCERIRARIADLTVALEGAPAPRFVARPDVDRGRWIPLPPLLLDPSTAAMLPFFRALGGDPRRHEALLRAGALLRAERGERLAIAGSDSCGVMLVLAGAVELSVGDGAGRRERCGIAAPGRLASAVALIDAGPEALDAAARERVDLLCIDRHALARLRSGADGLAYALEDALIGELTRELRVVSAQLARLAAHGRLPEARS